MSAANPLLPFSFVFVVVASRLRRSSSLRLRHLRSPSWLLASPRTPVASLRVGARPIARPFSSPASHLLSLASAPSYRSASIINLCSFMVSC
ncbi:hypothetical protein Scep_019220 [Stephania cephalantha]|uniref:Uncharacterized protein n=1 Tax=Stephania cephalantha TaxID=152367 RepID=A0AAP0NPM4_9MAGN